MVVEAGVECHMIHTMGAVVATLRVAVATLRAGEVIPAEATPVNPVAVRAVEEESFLPALSFLQSHLPRTS